MFDPETVAWEIKSPFKRRSRLFPKGYRPTLVTAWHKDPCKDGTDDSCGFTTPKLTQVQRGRLEGAAWVEARNPWFQRLDAETNDDPVEAESLMRGAVHCVAWHLGVGLRWDEVCELACHLTHSGRGENLRGSLCHLPGYHTTSADGSTEERQRAAYRLFSMIARQILRSRRPWYRHPRWHVHHWRVSVVPLNAMKRRLFTRCAGCGGRFPWGYAPVTRGFHPHRPRWFRGEPGVYHDGCLPPDPSDRTPAPPRNIPAE